MVCLCNYLNEPVVKIELVYICNKHESLQLNRRADGQVLYFPFCSDLSLSLHSFVGICDIQFIDEFIAQIYLEFKCEYSTVTFYYMCGPCIIKYGDPI